MLKRDCLSRSRVAKDRGLGYGQALSRAALPCPNGHSGGTAYRLAAAYHFTQTDCLSSDRIQSELRCVIPAAARQVPVQRFLSEFSLCPCQSAFRLPPRAFLTLEARCTATRFLRLSFQPQTIAVSPRSLGRSCGSVYAAPMTFSFLTGYAGLNGQQRLDAYKYLPGNVLPLARLFLVCAQCDLVIVVARPARSVPAR